MFYAPPVDYDELEKLPKAGGRIASTPDRLPGLTRAGGADDLPDLLSLLAMAGGADCPTEIPEIVERMLESLARAGGPVPTGVWLTRWVPYHDWQVTIDRLTADFTLAGYPEYEGHESNPPKFYRRKSAEGVLYSMTSTAGDCAAAMAGGMFYIFSAARFYGVSIWPNAVPQVDAFVYHSVNNHPYAPILEEDIRFDGIKLTELDNFADFEPESILDVLSDWPLTRSDSPSWTDDITSNKWTRSGPDACVNVDYTLGGEATINLVDEHTPCAALAEALSGGGGSSSSRIWEPNDPPAATVVTWLADPEEPREWTGYTEEWRLDLTGLEIGTTYVVTWETSGNGRQRFEFVADATTKTISDTVDCGESATGWKVEKQERYFIGGDDMGLDNIATAGRDKMDCGPDRLTGLATAGGLTGGLLDRLAGLASGGVEGIPIPLQEAAGALLDALSEGGGGDACEWPWYVILALLSYPEIDWGPWADRFGPAAFLPPGVTTFGGLPLTFSGDFLTYLEED